MMKSVQVFVGSILTVAKKESGSTRTSVLYIEVFLVIIYPFTYL
jgi:hypothetical protein